MNWAALVTPLTDFIATDEIWTILNAFTGAALGASFYVLIKTQPYLVNRSYDPKYNAAYISRFITGIVAGVILATAIGPSLNFAPGQSLSFGVLAILGGYAAEAVELIMQRLVEVILAAVRGDGSAQAQAKVMADQSAKTLKVRELLPELESTKGDDAQFKASLQKIRDALK